jgi:hypothetical protein
MINLKFAVVKKPHVVCAELPDGGAILLNLENRYFYTLNETAFRIWNSINGKRSISDILDMILEEYNIERQKAIEIIAYQIEEFIAEGLIEVMA